MDPRIATLDQVTVAGGVVLIGCRPVVSGVRRWIVNLSRTSVRPPDTRLPNIDHVYEFAQ